MNLSSTLFASADLAAEKLEAITTTEGLLLIIAGPGSGKTRTLVKRILYPRKLV